MVGNIVKCIKQQNAFEHGSILRPHVFNSFVMRVISLRNSSEFLGIFIECINYIIPKIVRSYSVIVLICFFAVEEFSYSITGKELKYASA